jgi:hypothetical protein
MMVRSREHYTTYCWWVEVHNKKPNCEKLFNNDSVASEKKVLKFSETDETYLLGFHGCDNGATWC